MEQTRRCKHGNIRGTCDQCYTDNLLAVAAKQVQEIEEWKTKYQAEAREKLELLAEFRFAFHRAHDRIDALKRERDTRFCAIVKAYFKVYSQAALKLFRRIAQAFRNQF